MNFYKKALSLLLGFSLVTVNTTRPLDPITQDLAMTAGKIFLMSAAAMCKYGTPVTLIGAAIGFKDGLTLTASEDDSILGAALLLGGLAYTALLPWVIRDDYKRFKDEQANGEFNKKNAQLDQELDTLYKKELLLDKQKQVLQQEETVREKEYEVEDLREEMQERLPCELCTCNF